VRERIGLDYFGIDCGLDAAGNLIVFEVNASMLVHDDNADYPYKDPFVRAIKQAFDAMLRSRAGRDLPAQLADAPPLSP
jgi:glutathione synthase/RimK-type ligase-like ATP-grasp enzyme